MVFAIQAHAKRHVEVFGTKVIEETTVWREHCHPVDRAVQNEHFAIPANSDGTGLAKTGFSLLASESGYLPDWKQLLASKRQAAWRKRHGNREHYRYRQNKWYRLSGISTWQRSPGVVHAQWLLFKLEFPDILLVVTAEAQVRVLFTDAQPFVGVSPHIGLWLSLNPEFVWVVASSTKYISRHQLHGKNGFFGMLIDAGEHFLGWPATMVDGAAIILIAGYAAIGIGIVRMAAQTKHIQLFVFEADVGNTFCLSAIRHLVVAIGTDIRHQFTLVVDLVVRVVFALVLRFVVAVVAKVGSFFVRGSPVEQRIVDATIELFAQTLIFYFVTNPTGDSSLGIFLQCLNEICRHSFNHLLGRDHATGMDVFVF